MSQRYLIKEVRERNDNEFIFGVSERVVCCEEVGRLFQFIRDEGYSVNYIDKRSLPNDLNGNSLVGYIIKKKEIKDAK